MPRAPRTGTPSKQRKHLKTASAAAKEKREKENIPAVPLSTPPPRPNARILADNVLLRSQVQRLKSAKKNAVKRENRLRKKVQELECKTKDAREELKKATAHGEAEVRAVLKKKREDELGWRRRLAEAKHLVDQAKYKLAWSNGELKKKISDLSQLRGALRLANRQLNRRKDALMRATNGSRSAKHVLRMQAKRGRAYKTELRCIARAMVSSGCKEGKVGDLMQGIARVFGIDLDRAISRRTVRRAILEGLVASQVQLGAEMKLTSGIPDLLIEDRRNLETIVHIGVYDALRDRVMTTFLATLGLYQNLRCLHVAGITVDLTWRERLLSLSNLEELTLDGCEILPRDGSVLRIRSGA
ncbi:hypothetical protein FB45DRAFT_1034258 [Roridomyces roridus]|uniref:Uncharacterized protein n=1 Tax=Roridomyces roridus TaxID=1738132 RepID=A0AAD7FDU7_9AGAR|nr:hypothetical protein FB45DRAFT_1034258 [Roridomyces roridus]